MLVKKAFPSGLRMGCQAEGQKSIMGGVASLFAESVGEIFNVKRCVQIDLRWGDLQCQTLRPEPIKKERIWLRDAPFAPSVAFGRHDWQNHDF